MVSIYWLYTYWGIIDVYQYNIYYTYHRGNDLSEIFQVKLFDGKLENWTSFAGVMKTYGGVSNCR